jgi:hypothetical protein
MLVKKWNLETIVFLLGEQSLFSLSELGISYTSAFASVAGRRIFS